jgi:hypothetical protein
MGISAANRIAVAVLGLDADPISEYMKYFPPMVKFGVPSVQASWAIQLVFHQGKPP